MKTGFQSIDFSATAPALRKAISAPLLKLLPSWISPNSLTLTGAATAGISILLLWVYTPEMQTQTGLGRLALIISAIMLLCYAVCDQLDGLQARRTGKSGPIGDFLDHWIDALLANLVPAPLMLFMGFGIFEVTFLITATGIAFWANNWNTKQQQKRKLPFIGGLEFIWVGIAVFLLPVLFGADFWERSLSIFMARDYLFILVLGALVFSIWQSFSQSRGFIKEIASPLLSLAPLWLYLQLTASSYAEHLRGHEVIYLIIGLVFVKHTGDQIRNLWLGTPAAKYDLINFMLGIGLLGTFMLADKQYLSATTASYYSYGWAAFSAFWLIWQAVDSYHALRYQTAQTFPSSKSHSTRRVMVDMSATLLHHGHIRLLEKASKLGKVVVGLTRDSDLLQQKEIKTELNFDQRKEVLLAVKYVDEVVETPWLITEDVLDQYEIDLLVHGDDNQNDVPPERLVIYPRTTGVSSTIVRDKAARNNAS